MKSVESKKILSLGELIKKLREEKEMPSENLAKKIRVVTPYIEEIESGGQVPPNVHCINIAEVLDHSPHHLLFLAHIARPSIMEQLSGKTKFETPSTEEIVSALRCLKKILPETENNVVIDIVWEHGQNKIILEELKNNYLNF